MKRVGKEDQKKWRDHNSQLERGSGRWPKATMIFAILALLVVALLLQPPDGLCGRSSVGMAEALRPFSTTAHTWEAELRILKEKKEAEVLAKTHSGDNKGGKNSENPWGVGEGAKSNKWEVNGPPPPPDTWDDRSSEELLLADSGGKGELGELDREAIEDALELIEEEEMFPGELSDAISGMEELMEERLPDGETINYKDKTGMTKGKSTDILGDIIPQKITKQREKVFNQGDGDSYHVPTAEKKVTPVQKKPKRFLSEQERRRLNTGWIDDFESLSCNPAEFNDCSSNKLSTLIHGLDLNAAPLIIPCGFCYTYDLGESYTFPKGINVEGKLL